MAETRRRKSDEDQPAPAKAAAEAVKDTDPPEDAETYPVERLTSDMAATLGYQPHEVAGALHGVNRKHLTLEEAKAAVKKWLESPVKED